LAYEGRCQEMNVDPADATTVQVPISNEGNDVTVRDSARLMYALIGREELLAAFPVADQELSINQFMTCHFVKTEKPVQFDGVGSAVREETNPDRGIDQDH
jgi:hypothetical protein